VTNAEYAQFLSATHHRKPLHWDDPNFFNPLQPVVAPSWFDSVSYCEWLSAITQRRFRLPTEAEWEYAARGGLEEKQFPWGDDPPESLENYGARTGLTRIIIDCRRNGIHKAQRGARHLPQQNIRGLHDERHEAVLGGILPRCRAAQRGQVFLPSFSTQITDSGWAATPLLSDRAFLARGDFRCSGPRY
jgi:hypothetical protein